MPQNVVSDQDLHCLLPLWVLKMDFNTLFALSVDTCIKVDFHTMFAMSTGIEMYFNTLFATSTGI